MCMFVCMHPHVHCSSIHNSQDMETTQMSIHVCMSVPISVNRKLKYQAVCLLLTPAATHQVSCWNAENKGNPCCSRRYSPREKSAKRRIAYCVLGKCGIDSEQQVKGSQVTLKQTGWGKAWGSRGRASAGCSRRKDIPSKDSRRDHMKLKYPTMTTVKGMNRKVSRNGAGEEPRPSLSCQGCRMIVYRSPGIIERLGTSLVVSIVFP